jgi:hypothetical protein
MFFLGQPWVKILFRSAETSYFSYFCITISKNQNIIMKNSAFFFAIAVLILSACGQQSSGTVEEVALESSLISEIVSNPMDHEGQLVRFEGTIGHICRHSGDKMRVVQQDDDAYSILVMLGDYASNFNPEFEGMEVIATGILKAQVLNIEELNSDHGHAHEGGEDHEHEEECSSTAEAIARLQEKGISPDIRTYVELTAFEIK